jgi:serine/threonine protein kinase/Tol biopolymer transport system component
VSIDTGTRLGSYEITASLGRGGMGEVYKARDTRLQRDVAIKVLPAVFAADPERLARFEREAQVLAALNHPNIAQIHGVEEQAGITALVMELVDGPTLAELIRRGRPATASATRTGGWDVDRLDIARQLVDALEAAHDRGIIHRDLKPQNIIVRADGTLKVLDFGLAKALDPISGLERSDNSPTITDVETQVGTLLGTAAYMAPEQVKGRAADRRADIWAFGVVLYELWTGTMAFGAETSTETLARVIERDPDWSRLPADTPPAIVRLLRRTLVKDPKRRLQSIGDARHEIDEAASGLRPEPAPAGRRLSRSALVAAAILLSGLGVGFFAGRVVDTPAVGSAQPALRAAVPLPPGLFLDGVGPPSIALSPDGSTIAFLARGTSGVQHLYVRSLAAESATLVPDSGTAEAPFFSPDGRWIGFAVGVSSLDDTPPELRKYSLDSGLTQTITRVGDNFGSVWLDDGTIVFVNQQPRGLWQVDSAGGDARQIAPKLVLDGAEVEHAVAWPALIPGTRSLIMADWSLGTGIGQLIAVDVDTRRATKLGLDSAGGMVLANGYLVYVTPEAAVMAVRFDAANRRTIGTPVALLSDVALGRNDAPVFAVAGNGTLAFAPGFLRYSRREPMQLVRIAPTGQVAPLPFPPDLLRRGFELSPDGTRLAAGAWDGSRWIFDVRRGTRQRLPPGRFQTSIIAWHPDGRRLTVGGPVRGSGAWGIFLEAINGGAAEQLVEQAQGEVFPAGWLPDGRTYFTWSGGGIGRSSIARHVPGQPSSVLLEVESSVLSARVSPDGRWLAYEPVTTGSGHVWVMSTDGKGERVQISARAAGAPRWSRDGSQLFFKSGSSMFVVDVRAAGGKLDFANERKVFDAEFAREYDVAPNGDVYSMVPAPEIAFQRQVQIRTRWFEEIERLMRSANR